MQIVDYHQLYFISDAHLGIHSESVEGEKRERIFAFGDKIALPGNYLFIIGDFFDFWYEWGSVIPKRHFAALCRLALWVKRGLKIYYLAGNHDFRLEGFLQREIGLETFLNAFDFTAGGKKFHLFHGDGLIRNDYGYHFLKKILRSPLNQRLFLWLHPDLGMKIADLSSSASRDVHKRKDPLGKHPDVIAYSRRKIADGFDFVILAHTHEPFLEKINGGYLMNSGNWYRDFSFGRYKAGKLTLEYFKTGETFDVD